MAPSTPRASAARPQRDAAGLLQAGIAQHRAGRLEEARKTFEQVLRGDPKNADALHLLGLVLIERGVGEKGFQLLRRAVAYAPKAPELLNNLAVELCRVGRFDEALGYFERVLALKPALPSAHINRARALHSLGRWDDALVALDAAVALDSTNAATLAARGGVLAELGRTEAALRDLDAAVAAAPAVADVHYNRARTLQAMERFADAVAAYDRALALRPGHDATLHNRAMALHALGRDPEALRSLDAALAAGGDDAVMLTNRGRVLQALGRLHEARASHLEALGRQPNDPDTRFNFGETLRALEMPAAAIEEYDFALAFRPVFPEAQDNRGIAMLQLGRFAEAVQAYDALLAARPEHPYARGRRLHAQLAIADWSAFAAQSHELGTRVDAGERADLPFNFLAHSASAAAQRRCAAVYIADQHPPLDPDDAIPGVAVHPVGARIRVAYLSGDLRSHPVSLLMAGVFEAHDRTRFEIFAIAFRSPEDSSFGRRIHAAFDRFIDVSARTDADVAALMRELRIDIAVDLMGHTAGARTGILARRAAPVQVNYLGYPGTLGAPYIDYIIADAVVVPPGAEAFYSERIVRMPHTFQANDAARQNGGPPSRAQVGLPESGFVFCSFNNTFKHNPSSFAAQMRVLDSVPGSVLWLFAADPVARRNLTAAAIAHGIASDRLIFADRTDYPSHLARLKLADLFLDSFPFNGGTTVSDALWAGLPVVTCAGTAFASRMAASLLHALDLADLVTDDVAGYESLATALALEPGHLADVRARLAAARETSPLFGTTRFCRNLETAFSAMHARALRREPPADIAVAEAVPGVDVDQLG